MCHPGQPANTWTQPISGDTQEDGPGLEKVSVSTRVEPPEEGRRHANSEWAL